LEYTGWGRPILRYYPYMYKLYEVYVASWLLCKPKCSYRLVYIYILLYINCLKLLWNIYWVGPIISNVFIWYAKEVVLRIACNNNGYFWLLIWNSTTNTVENALIDIHVRHPRFGISILIYTLSFKTKTIPVRIISPYDSSRKIIVGISSMTQRTLKFDTVQLLDSPKIHSIILLNSLCTEKLRYCI